MNESVRKTKIQVIALYTLVPLLVATVLLPCVFSVVPSRQPTRTSEPLVILNPKSVVQRDFGYIVWDFPDTVSHEGWNPFWPELWILQDIADEIPDQYLSTHETRDYTSITLKNFLDTCDRTHISGHGHYDSNKGPVLDLQDGDLYDTIVNSWTNVGLKSKVLVLSACNSIGHRIYGNPELDSTLASAIMQKSGVNQVIGYKGEVDAYGAAVFATSFWLNHLWANEQMGGRDSTTSFQIARTHINEIREEMERQGLLIEIGVAITTALVFGLIAGLTSGIGGTVASIFELAVGIITEIVLFTIFGEVDDALASAYQTVGRFGDSIPGLTYIVETGDPSDPEDGGGGYPGKGDLPW